MDILKIGIAFISGVGVGVLGSKKYFETKYDKLFDEEVEALKESRIGMSHLPEKDSAEDPEFAEVVEEALKEEFKFEPIDYTQAAEKQKDIAEYIKKTVEPQHKDNKVINVIDVEEPIFIDEDDYSETEFGFEKLCCHYYTGDETLLYHDSAEPLDGISLLGRTCMEELRRTDEPYLYVRNYALCTDYEIIRIMGNFFEDMKE